MFLMVVKATRIVRIIRHAPINVVVVRALSKVRLVTHARRSC